MVSFTGRDKRCLHRGCCCLMAPSTWTMDMPNQTFGRCRLFKRQVPRFGHCFRGSAGCEPSRRIGTTRSAKTTSNPFCCTDGDGQQIVQWHMAMVGTLQHGVRALM